MNTPIVLFVPGINAGKTAAARESIAWHLANGSRIHISRPKRPGSQIRGLKRDNWPHT